MIEILNLLFFDKDALPACMLQGLSILYRGGNEEMEWDMWETVFGDVLGMWSKVSGKFAILYSYKIGGGRGSGGIFGKIKIHIYYLFRVGKVNGKHEST